MRSLVYSKIKSTTSWCFNVLYLLIVHITLQPDSFPSGSESGLLAWFWDPVAPPLGPWFDCTLPLWLRPGEREDFAES